MKLSTISFSILFAMVVASVCNYLEDTGGTNLLAVRCIGAIIAIVVFCAGLPSNYEYNAEEGAY